jgi:hypothetical protein
MRRYSQKKYLVTEKEISKISQIVGSMEDALKEIIRFSYDDPEIHDFRQSSFFETTSQALLELDSDDGGIF